MRGSNLCWDTDPTIGPDGGGYVYIKTCDGSRRQLFQYNVTHSSPYAYVNVAHTTTIVEEFKPPDVTTYDLNAPDFFPGGKNMVFDSETGKIIQGPGFGGYDAGKCMTAEPQFPNAVNDDDLHDPVKLVRPRPRPGHTHTTTTPPRKWPVILKWRVCAGTANQKWTWDFSDQSVEKAVMV